MIINFPTGLYNSVLPSGQQAGNVTYTISSQKPPETSVRAVQLPAIEQTKPLPKPVFDVEERRIGYGELVFTITKGNRTTPGSNIKQFGIGETLEFDDVETTETNFVRTPDAVEIQHNTNILDLAGAGLSEEEVEEIITQSSRKLRELEKSFAKEKSELESIKTKISENQKKLNENNKALKAVRAIYGILENDLDFENEIYQKLLSGKTDLEQERLNLINQQNDKAAEIEEIYADLLEVSRLVN